MKGYQSAPDVSTATARLRYPTYWLGHVVEPGLVLLAEIGGPEDTEGLTHLSSGAADGRSIRRSSQLRPEPRPHLAQDPAGGVRPSAGSALGAPEAVSHGVGPRLAAADPAAPRSSQAPHAAAGEPAPG